MNRVYLGNFEITKVDETPGGIAHYTALSPNKCIEFTYPSDCYVQDKSQWIFPDIEDDILYGHFCIDLAHNVWYEMEEV